MNRLLHYNIANTTLAMTSASYAKIDGWDIIGKTGTTDDDKDSWFCGTSPYGVMATWCGFDDPATISGNGKTVAAKFFSNIMGKYLENKEQKDYKLSANLIEAEFSPSSGLIVSTEYMSGKYIGYYTEDNLPVFTSYVSDYNNDDSDSDDDDDDTDDSGSSAASNGESNGNEGGESGGNGNGASSGSESGGESSGSESGGESSGNEGGGGHGGEGGGSGNEGGGDHSGEGGGNGNEGGGDHGGDDGDTDTPAE